MASADGHNGFHFPTGTSPYPDLIEAIRRHLAPLREDWSTIDWDHLCDVAECKISDPQWVYAHDAFMGAVVSFMEAPQEPHETSTPSEASSRDEFGEIPTTADVPKDLRDTVRLIATEGLCPNRHVITPEQLLELLRHPKALFYTHLSIYAAASPYWENRLEQFAAEEVCNAARAGATMTTPPLVHLPDMGSTWQLAGAASEAGAVEGAMREPPATDEHPPQRQGSPGEGEPATLAPEKPQGWWRRLMRRFFGR